jgi:hypothetical protein
MKSAGWRGTNNVQLSNEEVMTAAGRISGLQAGSSFSDRLLVSEARAICSGIIGSAITTGSNGTRYERNAESRTHGCT